MKIKKIKSIGKKKVYDIEVEGNHNFFANDILVHNCIRGLMKKLGKAEKKDEDIKAWDESVKRFTNGAIEKGLSSSDARRIATDLLQLSAYSFNRSHSTAYSYIAAMNLYLSKYFRKEFYSAVLQYEIERDKEVLDVMNIIKSKELDILPPNISSSDKLVSPIDKGLVMGLLSVKYVGEKPAEKIIECRPYKSLFEFIMKTRSREVSSRVITSLIKIGALDDLIDGERKRYLNIFGMYWTKKKQIKIIEKLEAIWEGCEEAFRTLPGMTTTDEDRIDYEKELMGFNFFTSQFSEKIVKGIYILEEKGLIITDLKEASIYSRKVPVVVQDMKTIIDKNGNEMAFLTVTDMYGNKESVPVFASYWKVIKVKITPNKLFLLNLYRDDRGGMLFGQRAWTKNEYEISRMVREL